MREVFIEDGLVDILTHYYKGVGVAGRSDTKVIYRYLPTAVSEITVRYLY
jgi:hypothetical protein